MVNCNTVFVLALLLILFTCAGCATLSSNRAIDPQVDDALRKMEKTLAGAEEFSFRGTVRTDEFIDDGTMIEFARECDVEIRRPDKMLATRRGDTINRTAWYDGKELTILDRKKNVYASIEVPSRLNAMLNHMMDEYNLVLPFADLLFNKPTEVLFAKIESGEYLGVQEIDGHDCHLLAFHQELIDWQIWIDAGEEAVPRKFLITYIDEPEHPQYEAIFSDWNLSPKLPDTNFEFRPSAGVKRVDMDVLLEIERGE
ncbi:MAG: DUF2092 domain-containing protein [Candidatus Tritonobacter lacicola]|nr:DUF2092 domain-containing protein [Candidatus Tritonobacter lacicola]